MQWETDNHRLRQRETAKTSLSTSSDWNQSPSEQIRVFLLFFGGQVAVMVSVRTAILHSPRKQCTANGNFRLSPKWTPLQCLVDALTVLKMHWQREAQTKLSNVASRFKGPRMAHCCTDCQSANVPVCCGSSQTPSWSSLIAYHTLLQTIVFCCFAK